MEIRPVSDLRNKFSEIEKTVITNNAPVFLTKNGCGVMVLMSIEQYERIKTPIEVAMDEADVYAKQNPDHYLTHEQVFGK